MTIYLSWNVYHGSISGEPPADRIVKIVNFGMQNYVDVICLQECPQSILDPTPTIKFGVPTTAAQIVKDLNQDAPNWTTYYTALQAWSQDNPTGSNFVNSTDGYLIFYRTATFNGHSGFDYYQAPYFRDLIGNYLRPPVTVKLAPKVGGNPITVMNWHANTGGPQVASAISTFSELLGNANAYKGAGKFAIVLGDFNYAGALNNVLTGTGKLPFPNWQDLFFNITGNGGGIIARGIDHILSSQEVYSTLDDELDFKSDAYHYPIAVAM